jgi:acetyl-CoA carboxylase biotin carboxyl carrier protein
VIDLAKIERLMQLMGQYGIDTVEAATGPEKVILSKSGALFGTRPTTSDKGGSARVSEQLVTSLSQNKESSSAPVGTAPAMLAPSAAAAAPVPEGLTIRSPFVGTFYRQSSPESPVFVEVGSKVKKGQTLCIVEAMKLMNEIEAEMEGTVVAVLAENAKPVEYDSPLFVIAP